MHPRASELLGLLDLRPHPEGGHYVEVYRSPNTVRDLARRLERPAITAIYFLLTQGEFSRWHRVMSDEMWHYHEGDAIELLLWDDHGFRRVQLGPASSQARPTAIVPAGTWQAARPTGAFTLCTCTVGPGFDFADFSLAANQPEIASKIASAGPDAARLI